MSAKQIMVYVGTYTARTTSEGIYVYTMDPDTGAWTFKGVGKGLPNPSFLAIHPSGRYLYAANEMGEFEGKPGGGVSAFAIAPETGALTFLNGQSSVGQGPCHISVEKTGRYAMVANYVGGNVAMLPILEDGKLAPASDFHQHEGSSVDPKRQTKAYAHSITPDPNNRFALAADLGMDKVMIYKLDLANGKLVSNVPAYGQLQAGAGPRHLAFHPNGQWVYVIAELDETVTAFAYNSVLGEMTAFQHISTLPADFQGTSYCADIHIAPSGKFLYGSNRGHDSIVIMAINPANGELSTVGYEPTRGKFPRNFALDPTGNYLYAANQNSNNIVAFKVDQATGKLTPTGQIIEVPMPGCVKMLTLA